MTIKTITTAWLCALLLAGSAWAQQAPSLYKRLGGYDAIAAVTEKDWEVNVKEVIATLDKFNVPPKEREEVLAAISGLTKDIVEKP